MKRVVTFYRIYEIPDEEIITHIKNVEGEDADFDEIKICNYADKLAADMLREDLDPTSNDYHGVSLFSSELITLLEERVIEDEDNKTED